MKISRLAIVPCLLASGLLAACGQGENAPGPGGVTAGEARALDDAARMIEQRRLPPAALDPPVAASKGADSEAPVPQGSQPAN